MLAFRQTLRAGVRLRTTAFSSAASSRNASSLIIAEHANGEYDASLLSVVSAAKAIGGPVSTLIFAELNILSLT